MLYVQYDFDTHFKYYTHRCVLGILKIGSGIKNSLKLPVSRTGLIAMINRDLARYNSTLLKYKDSLVGINQQEALAKHKIICR